MHVLKKKTLLLAPLLLLLLCNYTKSDSHNIYEAIELIRKDIQTLERAVYSDSFNSPNEGSENQVTLDQNSEEVLTRHLLKLSEIEKQFQDLTNRFEEINFKLDKLSSRLSKLSLIHI